MKRCGVFEGFAWAILGVIVATTEVKAECCRLLKLATEPAARVQACQPDATEECGSVLWEADLASGQSQEACPAGNRVVYREWDAALGAFGPATTAVCNGEDVEL